MMNDSGKATQIRLADLRSPQMRAFHLSWIAFFLCFFAWFGMAPLMGVVREELSLTKDQVGWCMIGSVAITVFARLLIGWLCDRVGARLTYSGLLILGSLPVIGIGLAHDFTTFLMFRVAIGAIGASFVITQYHTSMMFAPNCVGTANAITAGWGNLGGGVTQVVMPLLFAFFLTTVGLSSAVSWRLCMVVAGVVCALTGVAYYFLTQDTPQGNFSELRATGRMSKKKSTKGALITALRDPRVWGLGVIYGCCFGLELTLDNMAVLYFMDYFEELKSLDPIHALGIAGVIAGLFGGMNLFARALGGIIGDRFGLKWGLNGRSRWLFIAVFCEGLALIFFSQARQLVVAIPAMLLLGLFVKMANGATYSIVPFLNRKALGSVSGIVGAGGNVGAVAAGFLLKNESFSWPTSLLIMGVFVTGASFISLAIRFSTVAEAESHPVTSVPLSQCKVSPCKELEVNAASA